MSDSTADSAIVSEFQQNVLGNYTIYASTTLAVYEFILLLRFECVALWRRKWTGATWLFVANRYSMLFYVIVQVLPAKEQLCLNTKYQTIISIFTLAPLLVGAIFSALRVHALQGRHHLLASFVFILGIYPLVTNSYAYSKTAYDYVDDPVLGPACYETLSIPDTANFYLGLTTLISGIISSIVVIIVTWVNTYQHVRRAAFLGLQTVSAVLLRDGSIYFVSILLLDVVQAFMVLTPRFENDSLVVSQLVAVIQPVLISRFLVNLRNAQSPHNQTTGNPHFSSARFEMEVERPSRAPASIVGPMGQSLDYSGQAVWDEYEDVEDDADTTSVPGSNNGGDHVVDVRAVVVERSACIEEIQVI